MHKSAHVAAARRLLDSGDAGVLPYAALELRMAMEAITYNKLRAHAHRLPSDVLDKWQPPQAMKALLEFAPHAAHERIVTFGLQAGPGLPADQRRPLGEKRSFDLDWLRKTYNKLGSLLHLPSPKRETRVASPEFAIETRQDLTAILEEVERVAAGTLEGGMEAVFYFNCAACERLVWRNAAALRATSRAICLEGACGAVHRAEFGEDDSVTFFLDATGFDCLKCGALTDVENRHLAIGKGFSCASCGAGHDFVEIQWGYALAAAQGA